jgi:hypothetical protein
MESDGDEFITPRTHLSGHNDPQVMPAPNLKLHAPVSAHSWDTAMATNSWATVIDALPQGSPCAPALRLMAINASGDADLIRAELGRLGNGVMTRGARLLALITLRRFAEVLAYQDVIYPFDTSPEELFDAANSSFAVAMAASVMGNNPLALTHLHAARMLATALGMVHRVQHIALEVERIQIPLGRANPASIRAVMSSVPMTERRTQFAESVLTEAYLALGDYSTAQQEARHNPGQQAFAAALQGIELPCDADDDYGRLTRYLRGARAEAPTPDYDPESTYARLIRAMHLLSADGHLQAASLLTSVKTQMADQLVLRGLLLLAAHASGASIGIAPKAVMGDIRTGLAALSSYRGLATFLKTYAPQLYVLLAFMPDVPTLFPEEIMGVPLFSGNVIHWQGRMYPLTGDTGSRMLARSVRGLQPATIHPQERKRFDAAWDATNLEGRVPVSAGRLAVGLAFAASGEPERQAAWRPALNNVLNHLRGKDALEAVQGVLRQQL